MQIIIRDDDTSYFTRCEMLHAVYDRLWQQGLAVCLSVVPAHTTQDLPEPLQRRLNIRYDLNVPAKYRGRGQAYPVAENSALCDMLNPKIEDRLVEITMHGYSHHQSFVSDNIAEMEKILDRSKTLLHQAFPKADVALFVPPYEIFSLQAREMLMKAGYDISTTFHNFYIKTVLDKVKYIGPLLRRRFVSSVPANTVDKLPNGRVFLGIPIFLPDQPEGRCLEQAKWVLEHCRKENKTLILVNHYWYFFKDWKGKNETLLREWFDFIDYCSQYDDVLWTTFSKYQESSVND
jgi:hypothetical protein